MSKETLETQTEIIDPRLEGMGEAQRKDIQSYLTSLNSQLSAAQQNQFIAICREYQLNPFKREIYGIPYKDFKTGNVTFSIIVGYEVYLKRAERQKSLNGWAKGIKTDGEEMVAWIKIYRKDWEHPFEHEVYLSEYIQTRWDKAKQTQVPNKMWAEKPRTMLQKVVIAQGFRMCFPDEFAGMPYTADEMDTQPIQTEYEEVAEPIKEYSEDDKKANKTLRKKFNPRLLNCTTAEEHAKISLEFSENHGMGKFLEFTFIRPDETFDKLFLEHLDRIEKKTKVAAKAEAGHQVIFDDLALKCQDLEAFALLEGFFLEQEALQTNENSEIINQLGFVLGAENYNQGEE